MQDVEIARALHGSFKAVSHEISKKVVGQHETIEHLLITLLSSGHALFVGVPGLAKTLLINTLAQVLALRFKRIQFTPDLMPSDITGTELLDVDENGKRAFRFVPGPVFCNILLADEINRTPPKTQAALLQSMQENMVTVSGRSHRLPQPFHVFATQNPIEQEGTYPLPEAQLDRFTMMIKVDYPEEHEEVQILSQTTGVADAEIARRLRPEELVAFQDLVRRVPIDPALVTEATRWVRKTRLTPESSDTIRHYVRFGAGPRAGQHLIMAAKARALMQGRTAVDVEDLRALFVPVLRHRMVLGFQAEADRVDADSILTELMAA